MTDPTPVPAVAPPKNVRWVLLGVMLAMLLAMLDTNLVGTVMPTVVRDLGGLNHISWVVTAYALATAVSTPVWGKLGDLFGRKRLFLASIVVFLLGSCLAGAAQSMGELIGFRVLQGLGAGGLGAGAFALIATLVPPRERGRYQGMAASVMAVGTIAGPLVGGVVAGHLGWRWAFYLNVPLGVLVLAWVGALLHLPVTRRTARIDWVGIALLTCSITATVLLATWAGSTYRWGSWQILGLGALVVVAVGLFVGWERRAVEPVLPLRIFTEQRNFPLAIGLLAAVGVVMFGCSLYVPLFQQTVQGVSATSSGLLLTPLMVPVAIVSMFAGKAMSRTGRYKVFPVVGTALLALGMLLLSTMDADTPYAVSSVYLVVAGSGLGLTMQMATTIAQNSVEMRDIGVASSSVTLFRTLGGSLGIAVFGSVLAGATGADPTTGAYQEQLTSGVQHIFQLAAAICVVAFVLALSVKEVPLRSAQPGPTAAPAPSGSAPQPAVQSQNH